MIGFARYILATLTFYIFFLSPVSFSSDCKSYLSSLGTFEASFLQYTDNTVSKGRMWIQIPGKARIAYHDPEIVITVNKGVVVYHDVEFEETTHAFLDRGNRALRILSDPRKLYELGYARDDCSVSLNYDGSSYELTFNDDPVSPDRLNIKTSDGEEVLLKFENVLYNEPIDRRLFTEF